MLKPDDMHDLSDADLDVLEALLKEERARRERLDRQRWQRVAELSAKAEKQKG